MGVRGTTASSPKSFPRAAAPRVLAGSSGGSDDDEGMERLLNTIPFSSGGGGVSIGGGVGDGRDPGAPRGAARTWPASVKSSAPSASEPGRFGSAGGSRVWEYKLEGRSIRRGKGDEEVTWGFGAGGRFWLRGGEGREGSGIIIWNSEKYAMWRHLSVSKH